MNEPINKKALVVIVISVVATAVVLTALSMAVIFRGEVAPTLPGTAAKTQTPAEKSQLVAVKVAALTPDPAAPVWSTVPAFEVMLVPQQITTPIQKEGTIAAISVQAANDGANIAWKLTWADPKADFNVDTGRFTDAVAIQLPLAADAGFMMGNKAKRVQILHWKALWQKDIDVRFQCVVDVHPNFWCDLYWFAQGKHPFHAPEAYDDPRSHEWFIAKQAGNPMSQFYRKEPVEELIAEGYGSLTTQPESVSRAKGVWANGKWSVVIIRPLKSADANDFQFSPSGKTTIAFAAWDGGAGNVGPRKNHSFWVTFEVQP